MYLNLVNYRVWDRCEHNRNHDRVRVGVAVKMRFSINSKIFLAKEHSGTTIVAGARDGRRSS
jgi:hypothetical protein